MRSVPSRQRPHDAVCGAEPRPSKESTRFLAARYGLNPETVAKWRTRFEENKAERKQFRAYELGYAHVDSCELRHADGKRIVNEARIRDAEDERHDSRQD